MDADAKTRFIEAIVTEERARTAKVLQELIGELVSEEREACAKIADEVGDDDDVWEATRIASLIRARK